MKCLFRNIFQTNVLFSQSVKSFEVLAISIPVKTIIASCFYRYSITLFHK